MAYTNQSVGAVVVGNSTGATSYTINAGTNGISIGDDSVANTLSFGSSTSDKTINIGFGAANHTIRLGVANGTTSVNIQSGSGGAILNSVGGSVAVTASTTATLNGQTGVSVGTVAAAIPVAIGNTTGTTAVTVNCGSGGITFPSLTGILVGNGASKLTAVTSVNQAVLTTTTTGVPTLVSMATDGKVLIGSTAGNPSAATLSAGAGIAITNGSGSISIAATGAAGGGIVWADVTGATQTIVAGTGYLADRGGGVAFTLPATSTIGDVFVIAGVQGSWTLAQAANQQIKIGSSATTLGATGSLASTNANDCIYAVASNTSASSVWIVIHSMGNISVA